MASADSNTRTMFSQKVALIALAGLGFGTLSVGAAVVIAGDPAPAGRPDPTIVADALAPVSPSGTSPAAPVEVSTVGGEVDTGTGTPADGRPGVPADELDEPEYDGVPGLEEPGPGAAVSPESEVGGIGDDALDPVVIDPCDAVADPQQLFVLPSTAHLVSGVFTGSLDIVNCSPAPLPVEFAASNGLAFADDDVILPLGSSTHTFIVDEDMVEVGAFELTYKLTQVGCCADYGTVHGFKQGFDPAYALDLDLTAGDGQGGCKAGCIVTAWVEGNLLNTSVELTVGTSVDAEIAAFVSTQAPVPNQAGDPWMPGVEPALETASPNSTLSGTIGGLAPDTAYYLLVRATDANGVSTFVGEFTTVTLLEHPDGLVGNDANPGCAAGCITHAQVGDVEPHRALLTVTTSMPATIEAWFTTSSIDTDGTPTVSGDAMYFSTPEPWTTWKLSADGLLGGTTYHVLVRATDANGRRDHQIGSFTTAPEPPEAVRISVERITMLDSGDVIGKGEVRFGYAYDGVLIGTRGEQKLTDDAVVHPTANNATIASIGPDDVIAGFTVYAGERDVAVVGFCEAPVSGLACHGINWNGAYAGHLTLAEIADLPNCETFGLEGAAAGDRCERVDSDSGIGDAPRFSVIVRYQVG